MFISDVHLGSSGCQAKRVARFLKRIECKKLYLVGDILDMWRLKQRWYWPAEHNEVVRRILKMIKNGVEVIYIPGNHDEAMRQYYGLEFGGVKVEPYVIHETMKGERFLVTHGDQYDLVVKHSRLLSVMGSIAYEWLIRINTVYNSVRQLLGYKYWSLSHFIKLKVKHACTFVSRFEVTLAAEAKRRGVDGVICGHIHQCEAREEGDVMYYNCGDWVESCTAIAEDFKGNLILIDGFAFLKQYDEERQEKRQAKQQGKGDKASGQLMSDVEGNREEMDRDFEPSEKKLPVFAEMVAENDDSGLLWGKTDPVVTKRWDD